MEAGHRGNTLIAFRATKGFCEDRRTIPSLSVRLPQVPVWLVRETLQERVPECSGYLLKAPQKTPTPIPPRIDKTNPLPAAKRSPVTTPLKDITEPTDRSIPLLSMTAVIPRETITIMLLWRIILERFMRDKKLGLKIAKTIRVIRNI